MSSDRLASIRLHGDLPSHVAVIMDGNGRWARQRGLPRYVGHREGMRSVRDVVEGAIEAGVDILTLFAFSTENWQRPDREIGALMALLRLYAERERSQLREEGVQVRVLGERERLDSGTRRAIERIESSTAAGERLRLNLMISYSGREEIVRQLKRLREQQQEILRDTDQLSSQMNQSQTLNMFFNLVCQLRGDYRTFIPATVNQHCR